MGLGHISLRLFPQGRRCENAQLDFKERQHGFSPRFGGMQTCALLKQYWGAVSFIYHDKEKHCFFLRSGGWLLFRECCSRYFHSMFPLLVLMTNSGSRVSVLSSAWHWQRLGLIAALHCVNVVQISIPLVLHLCFSLYHDVFLSSPPLPSSPLIERLCSSLYPQGVSSF